MQCPTCKHEVMGGTRWCPLCFGNVVDPSLGKLSSPFKRLAAYLIELLLLYVTVWVMLLGGLWTLTEEEGATTVGYLGLLLFLAYVACFAWLIMKGTTPGKRVLGMRVVKTNGTVANVLTMIVRELIGKQISLLFFSLGFLWILFDEHKQGWHDKLMSTYVVDAPPS